jgi:hypothetical protein
MCRYWSVIKRGMTNGLRTNKQTSKLFKQMSVENQKNLDEIIKDSSTFQLNKISTQELKRHKDLKRELVRHHDEFRIKGMKQLAEIRLRLGDEANEKIIQKICKAEANKCNWKEIQRVLKPHQQLGIAMIEVPHLNHMNEKTDNPEKSCDMVKNN